MNNELRENQINRDYYLKRAIIYLLSVLPTPFVTLGLVFLGGFINEKLLGGSENKGNFVGLLVGLVIFFFLMGLMVYHSTKSWKAYKECQELANPTLTPETATESGERERDKFRGW